MRVLILGGSGASHAIAWKLFESSKIQQLIAMPGNAGVGLIAPLANAIDSIEELAFWINQEEFDLVIPSEGSYLSQGLTDELHDFVKPVSGPPQRSAFFENSRLWTREFINRVGLPATPGRAFTDLNLAERYLAAHTLPVQLHADVASEYDGAYTDRGQAMKALKEMFALPPQLHSLRGVVIEAPALGPTVALSCFTDGTVWHPLLPVRMYDRLEDHDQGWFAPGMGAHTSDGGALEKVGVVIDGQIIEPLIKALKQERLPWWGVLGVDCAITADGPKMLRIRTTLSDPEAQVVLPRLDEDLMVLYAACHNGALHEFSGLRWKQHASVGVTIVQKGYPHQPPIRSPLNGIELLEGVLSFQHFTISSNSMQYVPYQVDENIARKLAGSLNFSVNDAAQSLLHGMRAPNTMDSGFAGLGMGLITATHARMLTVVGLDETLELARQKVYGNLGKIQNQLGVYRHDIGSRDL